VVAAAAMTATTSSGGQAALMAPTEILAEQHFQTLGRLLVPEGEAGTRIALLTSSVKGEDRDRVYGGLADGSVDIVVGTHALIEEGVTFHDLRFAVIDEQHRFGVEQRAGLRQKGLHPHLLTMTATPIPRTLELTVWGHLDISTIDEMPGGRLPMRTAVMHPGQRERAYGFVRSQVREGRQAFVICPLVEESDKIDAKAAVAEHERLQRDVFPSLRLGLLHGRMTSAEKEATMSAFVAGTYDILVATSVVEVGIDVPNASVMLIEGAERFGLAQLHQFRGRVGRGSYESHCLLLTDAPPGPGRERVELMEKTQDGFELAQRDLEMRGPGEFLGTRQTGLPPLRLAQATDMHLLERARDLAVAFYASDPDLLEPDNRLLARRVAQMWEWEGELH
jgi:ATP-dependent DNA helicase RecG